MGRYRLGPYGLMASGCAGGKDQASAKAHERPMDVWVHMAHIGLWVYVSNADFHLSLSALRLSLSRCLYIYIYIYPPASWGHEAVKNMLSSLQYCSPCSFGKLLFAVWQYVHFW